MRKESKQLKELMDKPDSLCPVGDIFYDTDSYGLLMVCRSNQRELSLFCVWESFFLPSSIEGTSNDHIRISSPTVVVKSVVPLVSISSIVFLTGILLKRKQSKKVYGA